MHERCHGTKDIENGKVVTYMTKFIFAFIIFLLFIWRIKKGFNNGFIKEIVTLISGIISLVSVALIFFAISSYIAKAKSTLIVCVIGLILVGIIFKICSLIFGPIMALSNISLIGGLDMLIGAVMGAAEACVLSCLLYYVLDRVGIYVL